MKSFRWRIWTVAAAAVLGGLLAACEIGVRFAGVVDQPVYDADSTIGYIPKADQHGRFLNRNDWSINAKHMGAGDFAPGAAGNVLLVGDSIVWGGNPYAGGERLGPQLQGLLGPVKVWPIAAGSWGLQNEVAYLNANPDVVAAVDTVVFVSNSGDFETPSSWGCSLTHPREKPVSALWWLAKKYALNWPCEGTPPELAVKAQPPIQMLQTFLATHRDKRVVVFLYPDAEEAVDPQLLARRLETIRPRLVDAGIREIVSVGRDPRWLSSTGVYRDGIHPTPAGMQLLARVIADRLQGGRVAG